MATVFTKIIQGELPSHMVWSDDTCVAFLSINPLAPGHLLVVPREEVDHWIDLDGATLAHLMAVANELGHVLADIVVCEKVGLMIAGLEVPHVHIHLAPITTVHDLDFANADPDPDPDALAAVAEQIRAGLRARGAEHVVG